MKRWQDRGEVLDSDDDELSLGTESQSPGHVRKKVRLQDEAHTLAVVGTIHDHANLQRLSTKNEQDQQRTATTRDEPLILSGEERASANGDTLGERDGPKGDTNGAVSIFAQHSLHRRTSMEYKNASDSQSSESSLHEALPDMRDLLTDTTGQNRGEDSGHDASQSSGLSSPLSERELSPPVSGNVHYQGFATYLSASNKGQDRIDDAQNQVFQHEASPEHLGRRRLRVRNEKQLHPYMFDRAQHQKQFRNYGIRPIRVIPEANETQDTALNDDGSNSDQSGLDITKPHSPISPLRAASESNAEKSDDDLLELSALIGQTSARSKSRAITRRKLPHVALARSQNPDDFSAPPSPPLTSGDSIHHRPSRQNSPHFIFPRGLTPDRLITPAISSALRDRSAPVHNNEELQRRLPRPLTSSRRKPAPIVIESSDESSQEQSENDIGEQRLRRERKRIKGVLPASWLKIDFRAQQKQKSPSPNRVRRYSSKSPPPTAPQRGVAQRVFSKRPASRTWNDAIEISDESEEEEEKPSPASSDIRQLRLRATTAHSELADDERMELDWIDPMLVGRSRPQFEREENRKRQSKITTSFNKQRKGFDEFSEERVGMRNAIRSGPSNTTLTRERSRKRIPARKKVAHMSIIDAPRQPSAVGDKLPQFVRIAMRRARKQPNQGRHSPSGKLIRLGIREDTEDAMSVLHSWRNGTMALTKLGQREQSPRISSDPESQQYNAVRTPLTELPRNGQQKFPPALRRLESHRTSANRKERSTKVKRLRQTQLNAMVLQEHDDLENQRSSDGEVRKPSNAMKKWPTPKRVKVQTQPIRYRTAQLESLEDEFTRENRAAVFEHRMSCLTEGVARARGRVGSDFQLARFLQDSSTAFTPAAPENSGTEEARADAVQAEDNDTTRGIALPHRPRKRLARRIDAEAREFRQPSEPLPEPAPSALQEQQEKTSPEPALIGLGPFGVRYATDFDILPLPLGTYFHESSFIGSGDFAASLNFGNRDLDIPTGRIKIQIDGSVHEWGAWTEEVATALSRIPSAVSDALNTLPADQDFESLQLVLSNVDYLLRSTARYLTRCLAFLDPVDRRACVQSLQRFLEDLFDVITQLDSKRQLIHAVLARCLQYAATISRQYYDLCSHSLVPSEAEAAGRQLLWSAMSRLGAHILSHGLQELRNTYEENRRAAKLENGLRDADAAISSLVVLHYLACTLQDSQTTVWTFLSLGQSIDASQLDSVWAFDKIWYDIFTIQAALEIDEFGVLRPGSRMYRSQDDWDLPRRLVQRLLELYQSTSSISGSTINEYVRATFTRCIVLINRWGWWRCESLLGVLFDFFARRNLVQLQHEENNGSPKFLSDLQHKPSLEAQPEDPSFHTFLKMLASALHGMRKHGIYPDKKIGGIAWRFIPNHGRTYRKDAELRQEDLDALRNHHDLLCTLYYAAPPTQRLRINLVQNLVDHAVSHREVCRLNIRAWSNLVEFQASVDEPIQRLDPFTDWFRDVITVTATQYRLAKSEVEQEMAAATAQGKIGIAHSVVEDTIARNQRQISASLTDALVALKHALEVARTPHAVVHLLESSCLVQVFTLFDPSARRLHETLKEALNVVTTVLDVQHRFQFKDDSQQGSDDSQDYGDTLAIREFISTQAQQLPKECKVLDLLQPPLAQLISNIFGADAATDDTLLTKVVDAWMRVALLSVRNGDRTWASYIHGYSSDAWSQLRNTEQRRKYSNYLLSRVVELGDIDLDEAGILTEWLKSLVEREAMLKFQHKLTSALLNRHPQARLLDNLPFTPNSLGLYDISMLDLRQRRLALLSTVLSNMRSTFDETLHHWPGKVQQVRQSYGHMLRSLMQAMKEHYQELQTRTNGNVADSQAHGAYVEFVQHVVTFLQQYSTDICPVDRFFTDSSVFPLPATDPTYVVGRLRSYVPKLGESRKRKELAVFVQTVSERAVVEGHQTYLINQLVTAMANDVERGSAQAPSLRHVLCTAIFPAYVEQALSTPCAWVVAVPILNACSRTAARLPYNTVFEDDASMGTVCCTVGAILQSALRPIMAAVAYCGRIRLSHVQRLLAAIFDFATSCLTVIEHLDRSRGEKTGWGDMLAHYYNLAGYVDVTLDYSYTAAEMPDDPYLNLSYTCPWPDTRDYVRKQTQEKFIHDWYAAEGEYYVRRGASSVPVVVDLGDDEEVRLCKALGRFRGSYESIVLKLDGYEPEPMRQLGDIGGLVV